MPVHTNIPTFRSMNKAGAYYPDLIQCIGLTVMLFFAQLFSGAPRLLLNSIHIPAYWLYLADLVCYSVSFLVVIAIALGRLKKRNTGYTGLKFRRVSPGISLVAVIVAACIVIMATPVITVIPMPAFIEHLFNEMSTTNIFMILMTSVAAPILEEIFFRGIILDSLLKAYKPTPALIYSSLLFAIIHFNPWQGIEAFFLGLFLGWLYLRTRSLLPCIFVHFVNNAGNYLYDLDSLYSKMPAALLITLAAILIYLGVWFIERRTAGCSIES